MLRHETPQGRDPGRKDERRGAVPPQRDEPQSEQQHLLQVQTTAGNQAAVETIHRTPLDGASGVIRRAGDKLAFEEGRDLAGERLTKARAAVKSAIETHRTNKRFVKAGLESDKERDIGTGDKWKREALTELATLEGPWTGDPALLKFLEDQIEEVTIARHKKTLATYHDSVQKSAGWRWKKLRSELQEAAGTALEEQEPLQFVGGEEDAFAKIEVKLDGATVYTIHRDDLRFDADAAERTEGRRAVFTKRGHQNVGDLQEPDPRKQFVDDDNGVKTRRFVTRAFNVFHLATMFGVKVKPDKNSEETPPLATLKEKQEILERNLKKVVYKPKTLKPSGERYFGQLPRDLKGTFARHKDVFNLSEAAVVKPDGDDSPNRDFADHYPRQRLVPEGQRTQFPFLRGSGDARDLSVAMERNEASSMQVRNGSGWGQPLLSAASVQSLIDPKKEKIIRANKGERFDEGAENQGIVRIDLSKLPPDQYKVVDQHSDPSHRHKISWDRVYGKKDLIELATRFKFHRTMSALGLDRLSAELKVVLERQILPQEDEMKPFADEGEIGGAIRSGDVSKVIQSYVARPSDKKVVKRSADQEMDEYIYSARKNREVLFDRLPVEAIVDIQLNADPLKWEALDTTKVPRGEWIPFEGVKDELRAYIQGTGPYDPKMSGKDPSTYEKYAGSAENKNEGENYYRLVAMHEAAERNKLTEGNTRK